MRVPRDVKTCAHCRTTKRKCDKLKPRCSRCLRAGIACSFQTTPSSSPSTSSNESTPPSEGAIEKWPTINLNASPSLTPSDAIPNPEPVEIPIRTIKKRDRIVLSCTRCHSLKIKCDRNKPCGRCSRSGRQSDCRYTTSKTLNTTRNDPLFILAGENPEDVVATWFLRRRGSTHWHYLLEKATRFEGLSEIFAMTLQEHEETKCLNDLTISGNYPFGSPGSLKYSSAGNVDALIESARSNSQLYIDCYMNLYQAIYPIIDTEVFPIQVLAFWDNPKEANISWVAQFLIVLGLGAYGITRNSQLATEFFHAGEACLAMTPYMFRPTILSISTLCLMIVAKQVSNATCWALDSCWNVMGVVVRLALMLSLQDSAIPIYPTSDPPVRDEYQRRLWAIVVYLDIQLSVITGQRSLVPLDTLVMNNDDPFSDCITTLDDSWNSVLPKSFSVICHFLSKIHSPANHPTYDEVLEYDLEIRRFMCQLASVEGNNILRSTLDIFYRRVLLCLHRCHSLLQDAPYSYPTSYWSSLECSLALLVHYRELSEHPYLPQNNDLISRPFLLDFFAAALTTCIHLAPTDAPLAASLTPEGMIPPRQTIIDTLSTCLELLGKEKEQSLCFRSGFRILSAAYESVLAASNPVIETG